MLSSNEPFASTFGNLLISKELLISSVSRIEVKLSSIFNSSLQYLLKYSTFHYCSFSTFIDMCINCS